MNNFWGSEEWPKACKQVPRGEDDGLSFAQEGTQDNASPPLQGVNMLIESCNRGTARAQQISHPTQGMGPSPPIVLTVVNFVHWRTAPFLQTSSWERLWLSLQRQGREWKLEKCFSKKIMEATRKGSNRTTSTLTHSQWKTRQSTRSTSQKFVKSQDPSCHIPMQDWAAPTTRVTWVHIHFG